MNEAELHRSVANYLRVALPAEAVWTTVGHGGGGKVRGAQLKARGLRPGWPDVQILFRGKLYCIELKAGRNGLEPEQRFCQAAIMVAGGYCETCKSVEQVEDWLRLYSFPLRASTKAKAA